MGLIDYIKKQKAKHYLQNAYLPDFLFKSAYIQKFCISKQKKDFNENTVWEHKLRLKGKSETTKEVIRAYSNNLAKYAMAVIHVFPLIDGEFNGEELLLLSHKELLPPWIIFPAYAADSIYWKTGLGGAYTEVFSAYIRSLPEADKDSYLKEYPIPDYLQEKYNDFCKAQKSKKKAKKKCI